MNGIDAWCEREARRAAARPTLAEALLAGRGWAYAGHRTRYLLARVPLRVALHLAEVMLLAQLFPVEELGPIFAIRAAMSIVGALWWGALEPLREDVRESAARRAWSQATNTIRAWLTLSIDVGLGLLFLSVAWVKLVPSEFPGFSIFDAYAIAAGLRLFMDTTARTYAAGIGALRRVPRPFWAGLPGDILDLCGALLLWPFLGPWGFAVSLLAGGALRSALLVVYARRAYRASSLRGFQWRPPRGKVRRLASGVGRRAVLGALGNATAQLDAWILLVLTFSVSSQEDAMVAASIHVLRPLLSASVGWARLFYLDFKQLQSRGKLLQARFERLLQGLGFALAALTAVLLFGLWPVLFGRPPAAGTWWLLPFLVMRSLVALRQIQAFSYGRVRYLMGMGGAIGVGLGVVATVQPLRAHVLAALTILLALVLAALRTPHGEGRQSGSGLVGLYRWLGLLADARGPVHVVAATVHPRLSVPVRRLASEIAEARTATVTVWGTRHVIWFERGDTPSADARASIVIAGGACLSSLRFGPGADSGRAALRAALDADILERTLAERLRASTREDARALTAEFRRRFPGGVVIDPAQGKLMPQERSLTGANAIPLRKAMGEVFRVAEGPGARSARDLPAALSVFCPRGEPEVVFVLSHREEPTESAAWRRRIEDATLAASLA